MSEAPGLGGQVVSYPHRMTKRSPFRPSTMGPEVIGLAATISIRFLLGMYRKSELVGADFG